jgi:tetratricopeptide (TPR) repeat protein
LRKEFEKAEKEFVAEKYRDAAERYLKIMKAEPGFARGYLRLGECFTANGRFDQALELYLEGARLAPLDPVSLQLAADVFLKMGKAQEAQEALLGALLADPGYPLVWSSLEEMARGRNEGFERHAEVIPASLLLAGTENRAYESLLADLPQSTVPAWREYLNNKLIWRKERFEKEQPGKAYLTSVQEEIECIGLAVEKWSELKLEDPSLQDVNLDFLRQLSIDGHLDCLVYLELFTEEYRSDFEGWKRSNQKKVKVYIEEYVVGQAQAHLRNGNNSSAIKALNEGVTLHQSKPGRAVDCYLKALEHEPFRTEALANLSYVYFNLQRYEEAQAIIERWIAVEEKSLKPLELLATIHMKLAQFEKAIKVLERAVELEEDAEALARIEQNLEYCRFQQQNR